MHRVAADGTRSECTSATEEPCCNDGRTDTERLAVQLVASRCDAACVCLAGVDCEAACGRVRECQDPDQQRRCIQDCGSVGDVPLCTPIDFT